MTQEIEFKFGVVEQNEYVIGDKIQWFGHRESIPAIPPTLEKWCGDGYMECSNCSKISWVIILIQDNTIKDVSVNLTRIAE